MKNKRAVICFLCIVILLSGVWEFLTIITKNNIYIVFLVWTPALIAILMKVIFCRKEKRVLHFTRCKLSYLIVAFLLPFIYVGIPYVIYWLYKPASMNITWGWQLLLTFLLGIPSAAIATLGEEIGWQGFLVPHLSEWIGEKRALLFVGIFWGLWHSPLLLSGIYMSGVTVEYAMPVFMIVITSVGVMIGILTLKSGSVWPAVLMHSVHNCLVQNVFSIGTKGVNKGYFVGETGIITAIIAVLLVLGIWLLYTKNKRKKSYMI